MFSTYVLVFEIYSYQAVIQGERCLFQIDLVAACYIVFIVTLVSLLLFVISVGWSDYVSNSTEQIAFGERKRRSNKLWNRSYENLTL